VSERREVGREGVTRDALLGGRVAYAQPSRGYRVCLEAPLLARFAIEGRTRPFVRAIDLGAGPGAVGLCLAATGWARDVVLVEASAVHATLAVQNVEENGLSSRVSVVRASVDDVDVDAVAAASLVVSNPPWFEPARGPIAVGADRARARAFVDGTFASFARAARRLLGRDGRWCFAMPSDRFVEVRATLARVGLHLKRARFVHPRPSRAAQVVFAEAKPGRPGGLSVGPPIVVRGNDGESYVAETEDALWGRWPAASSTRATAPSEAAPASASSGSGSGSDRG
jgi:tRNA1Val (adenine37-N6)-methyltransferase